MAIRYSKINAPESEPMKDARLPDISESQSDSAMESHVRNEQPSKVTFADAPDVKIMTPRADQEFRPPSPSSSISSGTSTPSSDTDGVTPLANTIANRLSFWSRMSKRQPSRLEGEKTSRETIESKVDDPMETPADILQEIIHATSPEPETMEEKHNALDEKILKTCIREFTKGSMYFAYNFGAHP